MLWFLVACSGSGEIPAPTTVTQVDCSEVAPAGVVSFEAPDGITLVADWYPADCGAPALTLLHMIPPYNTRADWPVEFMEALNAEGWSVLVPDRRGAGDSEGDPEDAYTGDTAAYDMQGAALWLVEQHAGPLGIVGASNGTTTELDYTVLAEDLGYPVPELLVMLSGGDYTENQHPIDDLVPMDLPVHFAYPETEAEWNEAAAAKDPDWTSRQYDGSSHGTNLFASQPTLIDDLVAVIAATWG